MLGSIAFVGFLLLTVTIVFLSFTMLSPTLLAGQLSEPTLQRCNQNEFQWLIYDCKVNPITGLGCIIPDSGNKYITRKKIAVLSSPCVFPKTGSTVVSFVWSQQGQAQPCVSASATCCQYNENCTQTVSYLCASTGQPTDGENQCLPSFLPVPFPDFDPNVDYQDPQNAFSLQIPCRENYC